jgi:outer membrane cobalamin receptor
VPIFRDLLFGLSAGLGREAARDAYKEGKERLFGTEETEEERADRLEREAQAKLREAAEAQADVEQRRRERQTAKANLDAEVDDELAALKKKLGV